MNCRVALRYLAIALGSCISLGASGLCLGAPFAGASAGYLTTHSQLTADVQPPQQIPCIQAKSCDPQLPAALTAKNGPSLKCEAAFFNILAKKPSHLSGIRHPSHNWGGYSTLLIEHVRLQI